MRVLVVEDNEKMASTLERGLREQGYLVEVAGNAAGARSAVSQHQHDAIVLDLMLPDIDGVELCRWMRRQGHRTPLLMLSALSSTKDKVVGLDAGADDYLTKPFEFDEFLSRIRALLRRGQSTEASTLHYADLELDLTKRLAKRSGKSIALTNKEFALLEFFMRKAGVVLSRTQIGESVWDMNFDPSSNVIDVYVSMLRRKIDKGFPIPLIQTVVGMGYVFGEQRPTT